MLTHLAIRDFAIISWLELELGPGMTVMTGETGAGKSILIDALGLALGGRASRSVLRDGCERSEVVAGFQVDEGSPIVPLMRERELESSEGECILRRVLLADGRSRAYVNGCPVPVQLQREIGSQLVDIHGQGTHQSLVRGEVQRGILDAYAENEPRLLALESVCTRWEAIDREIRALNLGDEDRESRLDFLRYQARELADLGLEVGDLDQLESDQRLLGHAAERRETCSSVLHRISAAEEGSAGLVVEQCAAQLDDLARLEPRVAPIQELLASAAVEIREAASGLRAYAETIDVDPERLHAVEGRLVEIDDLARKHRVKPAELAARLGRLRQEISGLENSGARATALAGERSALAERYAAGAADLRASRQAAAGRLAREVTAGMRRLGMAEGALEVSVVARPAGAPSRFGTDDVEFLVGTNPGQPRLPLSRIASGGELSRISLAIQVATAARASLPCLIFDEVDVGIGGRVAEIVGRELSSLGRQRQVLCVTHLPQVASRANHHLRIDKRAVTGRIEAGLTPITGEERVGEIARMLGGMEITNQTVAHAREMLGAGGA